MAAQIQMYKCLNPVGIQDPVEQYPLAPRLDKIDGKTIYVSVGFGGEQGVMIPLPRMLAEMYPNVNWRVAHPPPGHRGGVALSDEEMKDADAVIRGVLW